MKKLMFAMVAGVAATVATAAPITQSDFESTEFTSGAPVGVATNAAENPWVGKFAYAPNGSSENGSTVKGYGEVTAYVGDRNAAFTGDNKQYLDLSTDGGTLYRTINGRSEVSPFGSPQTISVPLYIDTLVQFTVCDSEPPEIDSNAKLAIWLQTSEDEATTNLMVKAKSFEAYDDDGVTLFDAGVDTKFVIHGNYAAGTWYRLTVEALPNVFASDSEWGAAGFKIRIDGSYVRATNTTTVVAQAGQAKTAAQLLEGLTGNVAGLSSTSESTVFVSLAQNDIASVSSDEPYVNPSLSAVGFSGTGLVDDILFTTTNPYWSAPPSLDFTLAFGENVTSVSYSLNGAAATTVTTATILPSLALGSTIEITAIETATSEWSSYATSIAVGDNASLVGSTITLASAGDFTVDTPNQSTAGATVSANANAPEADGDVAQFLIDNFGFSSALAAKFTTVTAYENLMTWVEDNNYTKSRVKNYAYSYERSQLGYPIEMTVFVSTNALVSGYASEVPAQAFVENVEKDVGEVEPLRFTVVGTKYVVDAGDTLTLADFSFETPPANSGYQLATNGVWNYYSTPVVGAKSGIYAVAVAGASVTFTTDYTARNAKVGIDVEEYSVAAPTYDFTVTFGENISSVSYTINGSGGGTLNATGTIPGGLEANDVVVLTPAASSFTLPLFYTVSGATTNYLTTYSWTCNGAAGAVTIYAADAATTPAAEEASVEVVTNAVIAAAEAKGATPAQAAAAAANVAEAGAATGLSTASVAKWVASNSSADAAAYASLAAAKPADVAAAVGFDLDKLVDDPTVEITAVEETTVADADAYKLSFRVKEGQDPVTVGNFVADYVKSLVKMSSSLESWTELEKTVTVQKEGGVMKATVQPATAQTSAFMKIGE